MNYLSKTKILLDSTYLLPIIGVDVIGIDKTIKLLGKLFSRGIVQYYYTLFNIFEIMGKISKLRYDLKRVSMGLVSIHENFNLLHPSIEDFLLALKLKSLGFHDLIDLLLYSISYHNRIYLLTRDIKLYEFVKNQGFSISNILLEDQFVKKYGSETN